MTDRVCSTEGYAVESDGVTVWVHSVRGHTIGRFGRNGIDVHTADSSGCLHCTHEVTDADDWETFKAKMLEHHLAVVDDVHRPTRFREL